MANVYSFIMEKSRKTSSSKAPKVTISGCKLSPKNKKKSTQTQGRLAPCLENWEDKTPRQERQRKLSPALARKQVDFLCAKGVPNCSSYAGCAGSKAGLLNNTDYTYDIHIRRKSGNVGLCSPAMNRKY